MAIRKRFILVPAAVVLVILVTASVLVYLFFFRGYRYDGSMEGNVRAAVEIIRDDNGVPHIKAKTPEDAYFALGYCHAQDRYNLMKYYRTLANGRLSKIMGDEAKAADRLSLIIGFARKAKEIGDALPEPYKGYLQQYVKGVNAARRITFSKSTMRRDWTINDVIAILLLKEWGNAFLNNRELNFVLPESAQSATLEEIFPKNSIIYYNEKNKDSVTMIEQLGALVQKYFGSYNRGIGFYVPPDFSQSDEYLLGLSFDSDLGVYPGWYPASIVIDGATVNGITHVGMPFVFAGNNRNFSFCGFNLDIDTQDFCVEVVQKLKDMVQYLTAAGWRDYEPIHLKQGDNADREDLAIVWATANGPVLNDVFSDKVYQADVVTLKCLLPGTDYLVSLFKVPFSATVDEAALSVQNVNSLPRAYLFATEDGSYTVYSGKVPLRPAGNTLLRKGIDVIWTGSFDLSSLRNRTQSSSIIASMGADMLPAAVKEYCQPNGERLERLKELLNSSRKLSIREIELLMYDNYSAMAATYTPEFMDILKDNPITSSRLARIYFQEWDYTMDPEKVAPVLYESILQHLIYETCADEIPDRINAIMNKYHLMAPAFYHVMKKGTSTIFDDKNTAETDEGMPSIFDRAFLKAMRFMGRKSGPYIEDWKWGSVHKGHFTIPFMESSWINRLMYKIKDTPFGGGDSSVYLGASGKDLSPLRITSMAAIFNNSINRVDMNFTYSTNPLSRFYYGWMEEPISFDLTFQNNRYLFTITPQGK